MIQIHAKLSAAESAAWLETWTKLRARPEAGFTLLPAAGADWKAITARAADLRGASHVVVLGTGGSSLGTQVISQALPKRTGITFDFLESPDPTLWAAIAPRLRADTHFLIVSKSGSTLETLVWVEKLAATGHLNARNTTLIASPGAGPLRKWAEQDKVPVLWIPTEVGGRYSVLTAVGMLPAALMGLDIEKFRTGAVWALEHPELAAQLAAPAWSSWARGEWITQLWSFSVGLHAFGEWWQQLWAESLAKKSARSGATAVRASSPMACTGPRDQHSVLQQLIEGARDKFVYVTRVRASEHDGEKFMPKLIQGTQVTGREISLGQILSVEAQAFERSLTDSGIHSASIECADLSEPSLGALFMLWQMTVAMLGERMQINPFDQPGVELGKKHAATLLNS